MSFLMTVRGEIRDEKALVAACKKLDLSCQMIRDEDLSYYSNNFESKTPAKSRELWEASLMPIGGYWTRFHLGTGEVSYDGDYEKQQQAPLNRLKVEYQCEFQKLEAERLGYVYSEERLANGEVLIELTSYA